jgi:hypothetical protein
MNNEGFEAFLKISDKLDIKLTNDAELITRGLEELRRQS